MASHETRVFVLGGESSAGPQDEATLIHVLDTSTYFLSFHLDTLQSRDTELVKYPNNEATSIPLARDHS